jgi:hypothetical protein
MDNRIATKYWSHLRLLVANKAMRMLMWRPLIRNKFLCFVLMMYFGNLILLFVYRNIGVKISICPGYRSGCLRLMSADAFLGLISLIFIWKFS